MNMYCRGCGAQMNNASLACPACGMPTGKTALGVAAAETGWFSFQGRICRKSYWLRYILPISVITIVAAVIDAAAGTGGILYGLAVLVLLVPSLAGAIKRLHDRDKSGWWYLLVFVPIVGVIWFFIDCGCLPGRPGPNRFGENPLGA